MKQTEDYVSVWENHYACWLVNKQLFRSLKGIPGGILYGETPKCYKIAIPRRL